MPKTKKGIIIYEWYSKDDVEKVTEKSTWLIDFIWKQVQLRWPELFSSKDEDRRIIQGSIGYTAITRTIVKLMRDANIKTDDAFCGFVRDVVMSFNVSHEKWMSKGVYSKYSSESGYKIVSDELLGDTFKK